MTKPNADTKRLLLGSLYGQPLYVEVPAGYTDEDCAVFHAEISRLNRAANRQKVDPALAVPCGIPTVTETYAA